MVQKMQKSVCYEGIGVVEYRRNHRARRLSIRIKGSGEVSVTIPGRVAFYRAEAFFLSRRPWVGAKLEEIRKTRKAAPRLAPGDPVHLPGGTRILSPREGENAETALWRLLKKEADAFLPGRLQEVAGLYDFTYTGLKIRKMTTRWGSCTARNSINLNSWLMILPYHLRDYVLLHELCHTRQKNHGPAFWRELDRVTRGRAKTLQRELRAWPIGVLPAERIKQV